jgi:photosystem II stability/assembly factor-like uncharacterized protein
VRLQRSSKQHARGEAMPGRRVWPVCLILCLAAVGLIAMTAPPVAADQLQPWDDLYSVASLPSGTWYAVGVAGTLLTSNDDGRTWRHREIAEVQPLGGLDLYSVRFADQKHGWICGEQGLVLRTDDGGETWRRQSTGVSEELYRLAPGDANDAIAVGTNGTILYTRDGGEHWRQKKQKGELDFFDATMSDASNAWVVGEFETILHTPDGGETWELQRGGTRANFRAAALFSVSFRDAQDGLVTGQSGFFATADRGRTWRSLPSSTDIPMYAAKFNDSRIWMAGDNGTLLDMALDAAQVVSTVQPAAATLTDIGFRGSTGIAVGLNGTVLRTDDSGAHWHKVGQK